MITISRGDGWQRVLRLEAGPLQQLPLQGIQQGQGRETVLQVSGHGLPPRWRVAIQGLVWPGVSSRHSLPGPDDWRSVTVADTDHLLLLAACPAPADSSRASIQFRRPLSLPGLQLALQFARRAGPLLATPVDIAIDPAAASVRLRVAAEHTRHWPLGALHCRLQLQWPDGSRRSHALCTLYVEN